jgi:hypothetical protein
MTVAQVEAQKVCICRLIQRSPVTTRTSRFSLLVRPAVAIAPVPDGTDGHVADLGVLPVQDAETG